MGVDLKPRNKKIEEQHFNLNGWSTFLALLEQLDIDLYSRLYGSLPAIYYNSYIPAKECRNIASAIHKHINDKTLCVRLIPDRTIDTGYRLQFVVVNKQLTKEDQFLDALDSQGVIKNIDSKIHNWVIKFVTFFEKCQGFWKC